MIMNCICYFHIEHLPALFSEKSDDRVASVNQTENEEILLTSSALLYEIIDKIKIIANAAFIDIFFDKSRSK